MKGEHKFKGVNIACLFAKDIKGAIRAMGAVFGDIGTSPLYTLSVIVLLYKTFTP